MRLFSTEQVSKYHPDKYADQISDAILDAYIEQDPNARVAVETLVKDNVVVLAGEINSTAKVDHNQVVLLIGTKLRYDIAQVIDMIGKQSQEIHNAVDKDENIAAGDQGIMFGYATRETESMLPYGFDLANQIIKLIENDVENNKDSILLGDAKTQVTVDLDIAPGPEQVKTIVISVCHCESCQGYKVDPTNLRWYIGNLLAKSDIDWPEHVELIVNPAGPWTIGGPTADAGVTGRKIVCDQYGGYVPVGGGAFSGKDPSKVDRSAAYAARNIAKSIVANKLAKKCEVQLSYFIGSNKPSSILIDTFNSSDLNHEELIELINRNWDLSPNGIINKFDLRKPIYKQLASYGHIGRDDLNVLFEKVTEIKRS